MRKSVFLALALLLIIGGFVFAQDNAKPSVSITAWGRGLFLPVISGGGDAMSVTGVSWGGPPRIGYTIAGSSDNVGFQVDMTADVGYDATSLADVLQQFNGDQQKIWFKPVSQVELQLGRLYDDTLRGSASFGAYNWLRYNKMSGDGAIFARVGEMGQAAFELSVAPVDGLYAYAGFGGNGLDIRLNQQLTSDLFTWGQYGAGYTIQNIGTLRAQYIGQGSNGIINAAFKLSAVPGLTVDVGGWIPTASGSTTTIAAFVSYAMDALTVNAMGRFGLASGSTAMEAGLGASYTVDKASNIGVEGDFRFLNAAAYDGVNSSANFMIGLTKGFSNGVLGIGFEGTTGNFAIAAAKSSATAFVWAIPIRMEYFF